MSSFTAAVELTLDSEGVFSDDVGDRGGKTKYGITEAVAREEEYAGSMRDLTADRAREIYRRRYWDATRVGEIDSQYIAAKVFDVGVNQGRGWGAYTLQLALRTVISDKAEEMYRIPEGSDRNHLVAFDGLDIELAVDGRIGKRTLAAANSMSKYYESNLYMGIALWQGVRYLGASIGTARTMLISFERADWRDNFMRGWLMRLVRCPEMCKQ